MNDRRYNYFALNGPNIIMNKPRYREEEYRKKNTYNFVTDPRLKRGRNYGIVYVTSTAFDENDIAMKKLQSGIPTDTFSSENTLANGAMPLSQYQGKKSKKGINKLEQLEQMGVPLPANLESVGSMTTEIRVNFQDFGRSKNGSLGRGRNQGNKKTNARLRKSKKQGIRNSTKIRMSNYKKRRRKK